MSSQKRSLLSILTLISVIFNLRCFVAGKTCGGILEGDSGRFATNLGSSSSPCVWLLKLLSKSEILLTVTTLGPESTLILYPEDDPSQTALNPIILDSSNSSSVTRVKGQTLLIILSHSQNEKNVAFSWDSTSDNSSPFLSSVNYMEKDEGLISWGNLNPQLRLTWALNVDSVSVSSLNVEGIIKFHSCDQVDPCQCSYFGLFEVLSNGLLREIHRACGRSRTLNEPDLASKLVVFVYLNDTVQSDPSSMELSWTAESVVTPETPRTTIATTTQGPSLSTTEYYEDTSRVTDFSTSTTQKPKEFMCPDSSLISPCTCNAGLQSVYCSAREVTQRTIDQLFTALGQVNNPGESQENFQLHLTLFRISLTDLTKLDLTPLLNSRIDTLDISYNSNLFKIHGPESSEHTVTGKIYVDSLSVYYNSILGNEGLLDFFQWFHGDTMKSLEMPRNEIHGVMLPIPDDDSGDIEFLPGMSNLINLELLDLGGYNGIRHLARGVFKRHRNLQRIDLDSVNGNSVNGLRLGDSAFELDAGNDPNQKKLFISLKQGQYGDTTFNGTEDDGSVFDTKRPTEIDFSYNSFHTLRQSIFEPFLLANEENTLDFRSNKIQCDSTMKWLKDGQLIFEHRVFGMVCANDPGETVWTSNLIS